jgi:hypothetical protein
VWPRIIHKSNKKLQKCNTREKANLGHMPTTLSASMTGEAHVGQVVTACSLAVMRIARQQSGGFGNFFNVIDHWHAGALHRG